MGCRIVGRGKWQGVRAPAVIRNVRGTLILSLNAIGLWFVSDKPRVRKSLGVADRGKRVYTT